MSRFPASMMRVRIGSWSCGIDFDSNFDSDSNPNSDFEYVVPGVRARRGWEK